MATIPCALELVTEYLFVFRVSPMRERSFVGKIFIESVGQFRLSLIFCFDNDGVACQTGKNTRKLHFCERGVNHKTPPLPRHDVIEQHICDNHV